MRQKAYEEFAKAIGRPPLNDREKQMAIVNYILEDKMVEPKFLLEIDDERIEFTGVYPRTRDFPYDGAGCIFGYDEDTSSKDGVPGPAFAGRE